MSADGLSRRAELLEASYTYALEHGLAGVSLRPLSAAIGSSPRVLLYLFGSKDQLIREVLAYTRSRQIAEVDALLGDESSCAADSFEVSARRLWEWLSAPRQRAMVRLNYEAFIRSVGPEPGPWAGFAAESTGDWRRLLIRAQPSTPIETAEARATRALALIRGLLLELLAGADPERIAAAAARIGRDSAG
ncbi:TetR/AcrR family transcriptional regulator [Nocardia mexicana]|uniref:TetR family transcriptional regulator n=1 Tax=Nocardia mexicana TaxID=279262 RepID=A0A370H0B6_9NOCA|nr:TetR/AcrR family transcriptional regulator [Nocardia mexicana]RDI49341.1 TetR family transcriptional regulator [Nocardia mexicana]